jgi:hypothetical protein
MRDGGGTHQAQRRSMPLAAWKWEFPSEPLPLEEEIHFSFVD